MDDLRYVACTYTGHVKEITFLSSLIHFYSAINELAFWYFKCILKVLRAVFIANLLVRWKSICQYRYNLPLKFSHIHQVND